MPLITRNPFLSGHDHDHEHASPEERMAELPDEIRTLYDQGEDVARWLELAEEAPAEAPLTRGAARVRVEEDEISTEIGLDLPLGPVDAVLAEVVLVLRDAAGDPVAVGRAAVGETLTRGAGGVVPFELAPEVLPDMATLEAVARLSRTDTWRGTGEAPADGPRSRWSLTAADVEGLRVRAAVGTLLEEDRFCDVHLEVRDAERVEVLLLDGEGAEVARYEAATANVDWIEASFALEPDAFASLRGMEVRAHRVLQRSLGRWRPTGR